MVPIECMHVESTDLVSVHGGLIQIYRLYLDVRPDDCLLARSACSRFVVRVVIVLCCSCCCSRLFSGPQFHLVVLHCPMSLTAFARVWSHKPREFPCIPRELQSKRHGEGSILIIPLQIKKGKAKKVQQQKKSYIHLHDDPEQSVACAPARSRRTGQAPSSPSAWARNDTHKPSWSFSQQEKEGEVVAQISTDDQWCWEVQGRWRQR